MPIQIRLKEEQIENLSIIRDLGAETLEAIVNKLSNIDPPPIRPYDLCRAINEILPDRSEEANTVMKQLMSLYTLRRRRNLTSQDLLEGILYGITTTGQRRWTDEQITLWKKLKPQLQNLLSLSNVWNVVKSLDLSYDYTNLLQNVKIITDIRPVFSEDAKTIQGSIVSYTLRLYYNSLQRGNSLSIALDKDDIKRLLEMCERALKKGESAKEFMQAGGVKATYICGEEERRST